MTVSGSSGSELHNLHHRDELYTSLHSYLTVHLLRITAADGLRRIEVDCDYLPEGSNHPEIQGMWSMFAGRLLGNIVPAGCVSLQLD